MPPQVSISFESEACEPSDVPDSKSFRFWAAEVVKTPTEIGVRIVDSAEGRLYNRRYRRIDRATNVLSFPFATQIKEEQNYLGDILMTAPIIVQEAREQNKTIRAHWAYLFVHALLHLQGYKHDSDAEARKMEALESKIVTALGFPDPWSCNYLCEEKPYA